MVVAYQLEFPCQVVIEVAVAVAEPGEGQAFEEADVEDHQIQVLEP